MDRRIAEANGADKPRLLSAPGRCNAARNTRSGRRATSRPNDAMGTGRPITFAVRLYHPANKADGADLQDASPRARTFLIRRLIRHVGCESAREKVGGLDCLWHLGLLYSFVFHEFHIGRLLGASGD